MSAFKFRCQLTFSTNESNFLMKFKTRFSDFHFYEIKYKGIFESSCLFPSASLDNNSFFIYSNFKNEVIVLILCVAILFRVGELAKSASYMFLFFFF